MRTGGQQILQAGSPHQVLQAASTDMNTEKQLGQQLHSRLVSAAIYVMQLLNGMLY